MHLLDLDVYSLKIRKSCYYFSKVIKNFPKSGDTDPVKNLKSSYNKILISESFWNFEEIANLMGSDDGKEIAIKKLLVFQKKSNFYINVCDTSKVPFIVEKLNRNLRDLLEKPVFERISENWIDESNVVSKWYNKEKLSSTKLTTIQTSLEGN